jgi:beta-glucanase (GH16 family)
VLPIDAREFHVYAVEWTPERVAFLVDDEVVRVVDQSPGYPMQIMLDVFALPGPDGAPPSGPWPKELVVDYFRGWRPGGAP